MKRTAVFLLYCGVLILPFAAYKAAFTQNPAPNPGRLAQFQEQQRKMLADPFKGVTTDGKVVPGLFKVHSTGVSTKPVRLAAEAFLRGLNDEQRKRTLYPVDDDEWRKWDNRHFPPRQGVGFKEMSEPQRKQMVELIGLYVNNMEEGHARVRMSEVEPHLDDTWFSWYGETADDSPFYYRVHSPAILVEFDHHPGVVFDNDQPTRNHVHTLVRTPNGGDYGADLLRLHHERYDHFGGRHDTRG